MNLLERFTALFSPPQCLNCAVEGKLLCNACATELLRPANERCLRCQACSAAGRVCNPCSATSHLRKIWVRTTYDGAAKQLIHALKFAHGRHVASLLAAQMIPALPHQEAPLIITFIPTAAKRVRERSFDQAELLAMALSRQLKLPCFRLLERVGSQRQVGASRAARKIQQRGAFRPLKPHLVKDAHILLIDDVLTTGSTLEAGAARLMAAGAASVQAAVFAAAD